MDSGAAFKIVLEDLSEGLPAITPSFGEYLAQAGAFCLEEEGHRNGIELNLNGEFTHFVNIYWKIIVTDQVKRCFGDPHEATEMGATGIAILLIRKLTHYTIVERSYKGTGFDYWLGIQKNENELVFQNKARLEISGIRSGNESLIRTRVNKKLKQTERSDGLLPGYIVVVEFSNPLSRVIKK